MTLIHWTVAWRNVSPSPSHWHRDAQSAKCIRSRLALCPFISYPFCLPFYPSLLQSVSYIWSVDVTDDEIKFASPLPLYNLFLHLPVSLTLPNGFSLLNCGQAHEDMWNARPIVQGCTFLLFSSSFSSSSSSCLCLMWHRQVLTHSHPPPPPPASLLHVCKLLPSRELVRCLLILPSCNTRFLSSDKYMLECYLFLMEHFSLFSQMIHLICPPFLLLLRSFFTFNIDIFAQLAIIFFLSPFFFISPCSLLLFTFHWYARIVSSLFSRCPLSLLVLFNCFSFLLNRSQCTRRILLLLLLANAHKMLFTLCYSIQNCTPSLYACCLHLLH